MNYYLASRFFPGVKFVTLLVLICTTAGCSFIHLHKEEVCNSRAYLRTPFHAYLSKRYPKEAPVRLGIIPFSVPANVASKGEQMPGLDNMLARKVKNELLASGEVPIVEVLNRQDWPGKRDEFYTGNFESIMMAKNAGYDLVFVGTVENFQSIDKMTAQTKIIETASGLTIWNGETTASTNQHDRERSRPFAWFMERRADKIATNALVDKLAVCITDAALSDEPAPQ